MIELKQEFLFDVIDEVKPLTQKHYSEIYPLRDVFNFDPDWDVYLNFEDNGLLRVFTARDEGILIGYMCVAISPNVHSKGTFIACDEGFFVEPEYRKTGVGQKLLKFTEKCLKEDAVKSLHIVGTTERPISALMDHMGYTAVETKFQKVL